VTKNNLESNIIESETFLNLFLQSYPEPIQQQQQDLSEDLSKECPQIFMNLEEYMEAQQIPKTTYIEKEIDPHTPLYPGY
jgi:hypothetical protein